MQVNKSSKIEESKIPISAAKEKKYRFMAILGSLLCGALGLYLGYSIISAFLGVGNIFSAPGYFFIRSYGFLSIVIPIYLLYAAIILVEPKYRPKRIFILGGSVVPFFTLAFGLYLIREFESVRQESSFIAGAGKIGTGISVFLVLAIEILVTYFIWVKIFKRRLKPVKQTAAHEGKSLRDIYAEAAVSMSADENLQADPIPAAALIAEQESLSEEKADESDLDESLAKNDDDVEKALAEATALGEEEAARHEGKKYTAGSTGRKTLGGSHSGRRGGLPYHVPVEGILKQYPDGEYWIIDEETRQAALTLKETFKEFNIQVEVTGIRKGPVITMFEILPAPGIRLTKIENLADNIALRLAAQSVRIVAPIPGKHAVGIEVPNAKRNIVSFREIIEGELSMSGEKAEIPVVLGKDITGEAVTVDLVQMPHLLIAGATGSGKSVCVNSMILTILYQKAPSECRLILIDPKIVELKLYNDIPHLLTPVITEPKKAFQALQYCICEMERRYACLDSMGVRDIRSYNRRIKERDIATEYMPYYVVVIDEFADLMATTGKELESTVARLAAMSRAVGIHLVLATQRPSIDVITGLIKANIPSRIAFMVASKMDSRIIIDMVGAEKLLGKGDMLYAGAVEPFPIRMQGAFISEEEVEGVVDYVKSLGEPDYIDDEIFFDEEEEANPSLFSSGEDPLYEKAMEIVMQQGKASASYIQRRLKIGYNRSARLVEEMEHQGVVGPAQGSKPRELLRGF